MEPSIGLENLPNELLAHIFSYLTSRDIVRLRYVSRRIRLISEVPSLWNKFSWPWYDQREERSLNEALGVCGTHVNRLIFPDIFGCIGSCLQCYEWYDLNGPLSTWKCNKLTRDLRRNTMAPSTAVKMLRYCCNVTEVTLGIYLNGDEVKEIVEKVKHLRKLEICHNTIKPIIAAAGCANLEKLVLHYVVYQPPFYLQLHVQLLGWVRVGFQPPNLSIVLHENGFLGFKSYISRMLEEWPEWNNQMPAGHTACFKLYCSQWAYLSVAPALQLDFGQSATYPFVKASDFGLFGFSRDLLLITNSTSNGKVVHKASVIKSDLYSFRTSSLCCNVSSLSFVTDFTATNCKLLSDHLEQLSLACPNLEQLNLSGNIRCLESLQGLRSVVDHCHNLQGMNLEQVNCGTNKENRQELWELLSEIKMLNHLRIDIATMDVTDVDIDTDIDTTDVTMDVHSQHRLVELAHKFVCLKQLELASQYDVTFGAPPRAVVFLSHLPSLVCCYVDITSFVIVTIIVDIITKCKHLKYLKHSLMKLKIPYLPQFEAYFKAQFLSVAPNKCLQYLDIHLSTGVLDEVFMDSVSAHGKLEIVVLHIFSVTEAGIAALIENSPNLCLFKIEFFQECEHIQLIALKDMLKKKFMHRKLFNLDGFTISVAPQE